MLTDKIFAPKPLLLYQGLIELKKENVSNSMYRVIYSDSISNLNQLENRNRKNADNILSEKEIRGILKRNKKNMKEDKLRIPKCINPFPTNFEDCL